MKGWSEPEVVAEYEAAVDRAQAGRAVPWVARQEYMTSMQKVARALTRSLDPAQAGEPVGQEVDDALREAYLALDLYRQAVARA